MAETGGPRGVSTVIGVVLIVVIVVLLAATVGTYVLQFGDEEPQVRPQVAATAAYDERTSGNGEYVNVTFHGGDAANTHNLSLVLAGAEAVDPSGSTAPVTLADDHLEREVGSAIHGGDTVSINADVVEKPSGGLSAGEHLELEDATVRLVWNPTDPDVTESATIWRWEP